MVKMQIPVCRPGCYDSVFWIAHGIKEVGPNGARTFYSTRPLFEDEDIAIASLGPNDLGVLAVNEHGQRWVTGTRNADNVYNAFQAAQPYKDEFGSF